jgi:hypothetical protein
MERNPAAQSDEQSQSSQPSQSSQTIENAVKLVLLASLINNINLATAKSDSIYVIAASIGLAASYLSKVAAFQEAEEQQIAPGVTTFANELKLISSSLGLIANLIGYWALLIEVNLRAQGVEAPQTPKISGDAVVNSALL